MTTEPVLIIISGLSGAGKSTVLHALEDMHCFCTDNLPIELLPDWAERMRQQATNAAVCIDIRSSASPQAMQEAIRSLQARHHTQMLFVDANNEALIRRYSTLRRKHPYADDISLTDAIEAERRLLEPLKAQADLLLDSSYLNPYELADLVENFWREQRHGHSPSKTVCTLISFSYQRGLPETADMVVDMRFLPNPHYIPELAPMTGRDQPVQAYLQAQTDVQEAEQLLQNWLAFLWPRLKKERKRYFTLAIGCSGGRHRSVYMVERTAAWMQQEELSSPIIKHRELQLEVNS